MQNYSEDSVSGGITLTKGTIKTVNISEYLEFGFYENSGSRGIMVYILLNLRGG